MVVNTPETRRYAQPITYDEITEVIKSEKYKYTYSTKKPELEIIEMLARRRIKFSEENLKEVSEEEKKNTLRKRKHVSKTNSKEIMEQNTLHILQHNILSWKKQIWLTKQIKRYRSTHHIIKCAWV